MFVSCCGCSIFLFHRYVLSYFTVGAQFCHVLMERKAGAASFTVNNTDDWGATIEEVVPRILARVKKQCRCEAMIPVDVAAALSPEVEL